MPSQDDPIRGILLIVAATMLFAASDTTSKYLSGGMPIVEFLWIRYALFLVMAAVLVSRVSRRAVRPRNLGQQIVRGVCVVASSILFVYGTRRLTMAEATTISFLAPLLITLLSIPLLGEVVGIRRWAAVITGLLGMLLVVRPGLGGFQPAALFWSLSLVITRRIATTDLPQTTVLWSAGIGTLVLTVLLPFAAIVPTAHQLVLALGMGVVASGGQWMVILAHRSASASLLAPFIYAQLPWATVAGFLVFGNLPDGWTLAGAAVIVASGLYTAHRERVRGRRSGSR
jgi:drug/metabolite transporter (DMT)-like permease